MGELIHVKQSQNLPTITERMGHASAAKQAKVLLGSYPREPHDPETFIAGIVQVLSEYPEEVGRQAIDTLTRRLKHYPTRADLVEALEEIMTARRKLHAEVRQAQEEGLRRLESMAHDKVLANERQRLRDTLGPALDAWWRIPTLRRFAGGTADEFAAGWKAAADKEAFCEKWGIGGA